MSDSSRPVLDPGAQGAENMRSRAFPPSDSRGGVTSAPGGDGTRVDETSSGWSAFPLSVYRVHPLLDPRLATRQPDVARHWLGVWRHLLGDRGALARASDSFTSPLGTSNPAPASLGPYFEDAARYVAGLLELVPADLAARLRCTGDVSEANGFGEVLRLTVEGRTAKTRHEARRNLCLAKLLFDIDHCRPVRDGSRHRAIFESYLRRAFWSDIEDGLEQEVCCRLVESGPAIQELEVGVPPTENAQCWTFRMRRLPARDGEPEIEVYAYRSRFKRDKHPALEAHAGADDPDSPDGASVPVLGERSGSILGKMLRRGIADAHLVPDLLGAMFIVGDRRQAYALERRLVDLFGGPLRWRDRVDTLTAEQGRARLDRHSSNGFQVLKAIVDFLVEDPSTRSPYLVSVEIQIFPLESYLRTVHQGHFANHAAYKRRQNLRDLLPLLFPPEVYGEIPWLSDERVDPR